MPTGQYIRGWSHRFRKSVATTTQWITLNRNDISGGFFGRFLTIPAPNVSRIIPLPVAAKETDIANQKMKSSVIEADSIMNILDKSGMALNDILKAFEWSFNILKDITASIDQQQIETRGINSIIEKIGISAKETVKSIKKTKEFFEKFITISDNLRDISGNSNWINNYKYSLIYLYNRK